MIEVSLMTMFISLAILQGLIIIYAGPVWKVGKWHVVSWPYHAAWGIGWVVTACYLFGIWDYWFIWALFLTCFPIITVCAQISYNVRVQSD